MPSNSNGVTVLRIGLKRPEQIAAHAEGSALKVIAGAQDRHREATSIELARDDDDPKDASLVSLLPRARVMP